jgi:hypothetical protein
VQRYWNATLVGPDVRRFLTAYVAILEALAAKISGQGLEQGRVHPGTRPGKTGPGAFFLRARPGPGPPGCC